MEYGKWLNEKPEFNEECAFVTAFNYDVKYKQGKWDYTLWKIVKQECDEGWYYGLFMSCGDEWGDLEDLIADMYFILPKIINH